MKTYNCLEDPMKISGIYLTKLNHLLKYFIEGVLLYTKSQSSIYSKCQRKTNKRSHF